MAPELLPFERRYEGFKTVEKARFLINEEEEEGSDIVGVKDEHDIICIDKVFKYAHE
jgi:hypothetical protein